MRIAVILALPIEYNTSAMLRCKNIIEALGELGHEIHCFSPYPDIKHKYYSQMVMKNNIKVFRYGENKKTFNKEKILNNENTLSKLKRFIYKIFKKIDVFGASLLYLPYRKIISKDIKKNEYDVLLSFSDPMPAHMIANYCKKNNMNLKYIQQWGDPLAADTISKTALPVCIRKIIERKMISKADRICYVSPFTCEEQKKLFPKQANKMFFLPTPSIKYNLSGNYNKADNRLCLGYFGSYNTIARDILPFYNAVSKCKDVTSYIIGDSDIILESKENVFIKKRVSPNELNQYFEVVDVIVCLMNTKGNQIPGKVYHDSSTTKDILFIKDGEYGDRIEEFFSKYNHYTFVSNKENEIMNILNTYVKKGVPVREPIKEYEACNIAKKLIDFAK